MTATPELIGCISKRVERTIRTRKRSRVGVRSGETLSHMVAMARAVKVHTTADAYCKLKIGRFEKTTASMGYTKQVSGDSSAEIARNQARDTTPRQRLIASILRDEVAKLQNRLPEMDQTRTRPTRLLQYSSTTTARSAARIGVSWQMNRTSCDVQRHRRMAESTESSCPQRRKLQKSDDRSVIRS
jgi:hypothetical protein